MGMCQVRQLLYKLEPNLSQKLELVRHWSNLHRSCFIFFDFINEITSTCKQMALQPKTSLKKNVYTLSNMLQHQSTVV